MPEGLAEILVTDLQRYGIAGLVFAVPFVTRGVNAIAPLLFWLLLTTSHGWLTVSGFPFQFAGLLALAILLVMAAASHDFWLRTLTAPVYPESDYQRESNALFLLWRGIGEIVAREPQYRRLSGSVSIAAEYGSLTQHLLARCLRSGGFVSHLAASVRARRPLKPELEASLLVRATVASELEAVATLVKEIEAGRGIAVLLRHYLKLKARLLGSASIRSVQTSSTGSCSWICSR